MFGENDLPVKYATLTPSFINVGVTRGYSSPFAILLLSVPILADLRIAAQVILQIRLNILQLEDWKALLLFNTDAFYELNVVVQQPSRKYRPKPLLAKIEVFLKLLEK